MLGEEHAAILRYLDNMQTELKEMMENRTEKIEKVEDYNGTCHAITR